MVLLITEYLWGYSRYTSHDVGRSITSSPEVKTDGEILHSGRRSG